VIPPGTETIYGIRGDMAAVRGQGDSSHAENRGSGS
jgi:hypothetical protein